MCQECEQMEGKLGHYRKLAELIQDPPVKEGLQRLIAEIETAKVKLHLSAPETGISPQSPQAASGTTGQSQPDQSASPAGGFEQTPGNESNP